MATTAATPKIIPSMVSSERSLWLARFSKPRATSGSHCARDLGSAREPVVIFAQTALFHTRTRGRPRVARFGLFGCAGLRIDQRDHRARLNAFEDGATFAERADLDLLCLETAVLLQYTIFLPPRSKTASLGMETALDSWSPRIPSSAAKPGRSRGSGLSRRMVTSNLRWALSSQNSWDVAPPTVSTLPVKRSPGNALTWMSTGSPGLRLL